MNAEAQELPYDAVFAAVPAPLLVLTPDLTICEANDAYLKAVGRCREDLLGRFMFDVFPEPDHPENGGRDLVRASLERARDTGQPETMGLQRYDILMPGGQLEQRYWSPIHVPVVDETGQTVLLLHRAEDVTEYVQDQQRRGSEPTQELCWRRRMQEAEADLFLRARELEALNHELRMARDQLAARALHDPMTGLLIRPAIVEHVSRALARLARRPHLVAVLFVDLDGLKHVNDTYGHAAGDALIRCFAEQLRSSVRPSDPVARFGGDEFVVLLDDVSGLPDVEAVVERVLEGARRCTSETSLPTHPSASVGIALTSGRSCPRRRSSRARTARCIRPSRPVATGTPASREAPAQARPGRPSSAAVIRAVTSSMSPTASMRIRMSRPA